MASDLESAESHFQAGVEDARAGRSDSAREHFTQAVRLNPNHAYAHSRLGGILLEVGQIEEGARHRVRAYELAPDDDEIAIVHAAFLELNRQNAAADEIIDRLIEKGNESTKLAKIYAAIAKRNKCQDKALNLIDRILANGKPRTPRLEASLHFSAADLLDSLGRYDEAFDRATLGSSLRGAKYNARHVELFSREQIQCFTKPALRRLPHAMHESELPVFVVGMPRSGTTLVEQILASHPKGHGAGELTRIGQLSDSLIHLAPKSTLAQRLDRLSMNDVDELAEKYLQPLRALNPSAERIIDKMPHNFANLGLIQLLFPLSRVIYCRRDALDIGVSCYLTNFLYGNDFSFALPTIGHYHREHEIIMAHWKSTLSLQIMDVVYEEMVNDVEGQARRLVDFIGLPWDDNCLRFYESQRFVATASNAQVREPIYSKSVGRWKNYDRHLSPLREALVKS